MIPVGFEKYIETKKTESPCFFCGKEGVERTFSKSRPVCDDCLPFPHSEHYNDIVMNFLFPLYYPYSLEGLARAKQYGLIIKKHGTN